MKKTFLILLPVLFLFCLSVIALYAQVEINDEEEVGENGSVSNLADYYELNGEGETEEPGSEEGAPGENVTGMVAEDTVRTAGTPPVALAQTKLCGIYQNPYDFKYYVSSHTNLYVFAFNTEENSVPVSEIEVAIDDGPFYSYSGTQLIPENAPECESYSGDRYDGVRTGYFFLREEGPHTITFRSIDSLGNIERNNVVVVWVDNTPPSIEAQFNDNEPCKLYVKNGIRYIPADHAISLFYMDSGSGVDEDKVLYSVENGNWTVYNKNEPFSFQNDGWNVLRIKATDFVGNESDERVYNVYVDTQAPEISIVAKYAPIEADGNLYAGVDNSYSVVTMDQESGLSEVLIRVDGDTSRIARWDIYRRPIVFTTTGMHTIEVIARDNVCNETINEVYTVYVDVVPPSSLLYGFNPEEDQDAQPQERGTTQPQTTDEDNGEATTNDTTDEEAAPDTTDQETTNGEDEAETTSNGAEPVDPGDQGPDIENS